MPYFLVDYIENQTETHRDDRSISELLGQKSLNSRIKSQSFRCFAHMSRPRFPRFLGKNLSSVICFRRAVEHIRTDLLFKNCRK